MHAAVKEQFVLIPCHIPWLPLAIAEQLLSELKTAGMAERVGVRITGDLGLAPGWIPWGPYSRLIVDRCKRLGVEVVAAFVAFNLSDHQLTWHKDRGDVNVGRAVFNLGGGGVVGLRCGGEDQHYSLEHGDGYFMGPIASGKAPVSDGGRAMKEKAARDMAARDRSWQDLVKILAGRSH
ncbi:hypothetical protein HaLaN_04276 [Haematococcus lacustris]|uniref:Uncharacterized protein n=1 Tax=Haematococcus lacustris TaxID=44745 RepID=A0A699YN07_HAELA|nr:hypothetical protein HaLaN_04276 [Haematococcus lacustris]